MRKIKLTESQIQRLKSRLNENTEKRYQKEVKVWFNLSGEISDKEISEITSDMIQITYLINIGYEPWGISDVSLYGISGPESIQVNLEYFIDDSDATETTSFPLRIDWGKVEIKKEKGTGVVMVDEIIVYLAKDSNGQINAISVVAQVKMI